MNYMKTRPEYFITLIEQDGGWMAIGSRKIRYLDVEAKVEYESFYGSLDMCIREPGHAWYTIDGQVDGFTMCHASTQLAALGTLLDAFRREEEEERNRNLDYARRQEDIERFGTEVNESLLKEVRKWQKKQAKKKAKLEREYYEEEYDF